MSEPLHGREASGLGQVAGKPSVAQTYEGDRARALILSIGDYKGARECLI
jgi:hypothetical protein